MLLAVWGMCSSFYMTHTMIGRKKNNDSLEKKKKSTRLDLAAKQLSFLRFRCFRFENGYKVSSKTKEKAM